MKALKITLFFLILLYIQPKETLAQVKKNEGLKIFIVGLKTATGTSTQLTKDLTAYLKQDLADLGIETLTDGLAASIMNLKKKWTNSNNNQKPSDFEISPNDSKNLPKYAIFGEVERITSDDSYIYTLETYCLESMGSKYVYRYVRGVRIQLLNEAASNSHTGSFHTEIQITHNELYMKLHNYWSAQVAASPPLRNDDSKKD